MKVESIKTSYYNSTNFTGNRISKISQKISVKDFAFNSEPEEFKALRKIYDDFWKKLSIFKNLKPNLEYNKMKADMAFSFQDYTIYVNKNISPFRMNIRNKSGKNTAMLRHEIEHLFQRWMIIRLLGAEEYCDIWNYPNSEVKMKSLKKAKEIEKTLGRVSADSPEGIVAKLFLEACVNYPELKFSSNIFDIKEIIQYHKYKNNFIELCADEAAKSFEPSLLKKIKVAIEEFIKLF